MAVCPLGTSAENWVVSLNATAELQLNPDTTRWFFNNGHWNAVSLENGKLAVYSQTDTSTWVEVDKFGPSDTSITTFIFYRR
jgi:hypothetical protein